MNTNTGKVFQRLARLGYTLGMVSMLAAAMLSVINQPVSAFVNSSAFGNSSRQGGQTEGDTTPTAENEENQGNSVQTFGGNWQGEDPTKTPKPTNTPKPTKTPKDGDPTSTNEPPTATNVPPTATEVPPTATDVPPTATSTPTEEPTIQTAPSETPTLTPTMAFTLTATPTDSKEKELKLNLSHIVCKQNGTVEIHFVLLNVPDGVTPGTLTYTYGTIPPGANTGNVWHYTDNKPSGYYNITSASVQVSGQTVTLHNPGAYEGLYNCGGPTPTLSTQPSDTPTPTSTNTPTSTPTDTPTQTPTPTPTDTPTNTPTYTPTETPTNTPTLTPTEVPFADLQLAWACVQGVQQWTVTNTNDFDVEFDWELNEAGDALVIDGAKLASPKKIAAFAIDSGTATVPANSALLIFTAGGYHTMTIRWTNGEVLESLNLTTSPTSPCLQIEPSSTPTLTVGNTQTPDPTNTPQGGSTPTSTPQGGTTPTNTPTTSSTPPTTLRLNPSPTRLPTIVFTLTPDPVELAMVDPELLIPVTGADVSGNPLANQSLSNFFLNLGFIFFGMAFVSQGFANKLTKKRDQN